MPIKFIEFLNIYIYIYMAEANVCSVQFNLVSRYCIAYSCANQKTYYMDLRCLSQPLCFLDDHRKAVSYCQVQYLVTA